MGVALLLGSALALGACGAGSGSDATAAPAGGNVSPTTTYAKGVPTLQQLYAGNEGTPPTSGPKAKAGAKVIWVSCGGETPGCAKPADYFLEAAKSLGWSASVVDGKLNVNNGFSNAIRTAIAQKPAAIIAHGINCVEAKSALEEAKAAGIPLIEASSVDCPGGSLYSQKEIFSESARDTTQFYEEFATKQADYVIDQTQGKAKVILLEFQGPWGKSMGDAWRREFAKCKGCQIVDTIKFEGNQLAPNGPVNQQFTTDLVKYPQANAAVLAFDTLATYTGLPKAVVDAGRAKDLLMVGGEGFAAATELIRSGQGLSADGGAYDNRWASWAIADETNRLLNGAPAVPEGIGFTVIDKDHNMPPSGSDYFSNVDYRGAYTKVWTGE
ncbi:sugar ABC transporter substrate-binding protein [Marmoricola sp. URHA0025 HA25]